MSRISLTFTVAALIAAGGAFAQNAPAPSSSSSPAEPRSAVQSPSAPQTNAAQSQAQPRQTQTGQAANSAQPSGQRQAQTRQSVKAPQSTTETRPDAKYPHPSGQDSQPAHSTGTTTLPAVGSKKDKESGQDQNPKATGRSKQMDQLARQKAYQGSSGSKANPGTACSTARPTVDGGIDCGTSGNSATMGKIVTKSH